MDAELELYAQHSSFGHLLNELLRTAYVRLLQPRMVCGATQAGLLSMLIKLQWRKRVLELGAYSGCYSTIAMAIALEPVAGEVDSIECDAEMMLLTPFVARSGCAERIHIHHGQALELMPTLLARDYDASTLMPTNVSTPTTTSYCANTYRALRR